MCADYGRYYWLCVCYESCLFTIRSKSVRIFWEWFYYILSALWGHSQELMVCCLAFIVLWWEDYACLQSSGGESWMRGWFYETWRTMSISLSVNLYLWNLTLYSHQFLVNYLNGRYKYLWVFIFGSPKNYISWVYSFANHLDREIFCRY